MSANSLDFPGGTCAMEILIVSMLLMKITVVCSVG